jgi:ABC-type dipeptide/oligopeptide/nickel transport system permease component
MIAHFGLDRPVLEQYARFWRAIAEGEFGLGLLERRSVAVIFAERIGPSLRLLLLTIALTVAIGVPLGAAAALTRSRC